MINNRNKSVVRGMKWTSDGQKICIVYEDGEAHKNCLYIYMCVCICMLICLCFTIDYLEDSWIFFFKCYQWHDLN